MNRFYKITLPFIFIFISTFTHSIFAQKGFEKVINTGDIIKESISASEQHTYTIVLKNGMAIIGEVYQKNLDLTIDLFNPSGEFIKQINSTNGINGAAPIDFTANASGKYKLVIRNLDKKAENGTYTLKVEQILSLSANTKRITKKELPTKTLFDLWEASLTDSTVIYDFISNQKEKHIIEAIDGNDAEMLVTYFCIPNEPIEYVMLSGGPDFLGLRFQKLVNTKLFYVTQLVPKDARFNYGFNYFNLHKAGPNDEIESREVIHAYDGTVEMPDAPRQDYIDEREGVARGAILPTSVYSDILNEDRKITLHIPANYDKNTPHNLLIIFDGESYGGRPNRYARIPTPTIMDNLTAEGKITPTVTLLVWSMGKRSTNLISEKFGDFIAKELIPWARNNYNIYSQAGNIVLAGSSRGGFAASFIALNHSNIIGNVLSQSGSYWIKGTKNENHWIYPEGDGKLIKAFMNSDQLPINFYMDIGLYDAGASMLGMNRQFRDILITKGYEVDYHEFKGGHNYVNWRGTLSDGLISLIGTEKQ